MRAGGVASRAFAIVQPDDKTQAEKYTVRMGETEKQREAGRGLSPRKARGARIQPVHVYDA